MKTALMLLCTLLLSGAVLAEAPEFHLDEPISLDLKDAKVTEVITLLGAIAHLPVVIDPSIRGSITIRFQDVPYETALRRISEPLDFTLKIEGGKLVAAPRRAIPPERRAAASAGSLPAGPRLAAEDYRGAFKELSPLFLRWRSGGMERCSRLTFKSGSTFDADGLPVTQFGWEPVTGTRLLAVDGPDRLRAVAIGEPPALPGELRLSDRLSLLAREPLNEPCPEAAGSASSPSSGNAVTFALRVDELRDDGGRVALSAPRIRARPGTAFSFRSGLADAGGQTREVIVFGFLSSDGRSLVATLAATALLTDSDGREYMYAQATGRDEGSSAPVPLPTAVLGSDEVVIASLGKGTALTRPVELRVFRPDN